MARYGTVRPDLVLAHVDTPGQSGWLLTAKIRLAGPSPPVWLYKRRKSARDVAMADFVGAEEMLEYRGDPRALSDAVLRYIAGKPAAPSGLPETFGEAVSRAVV
jgi:DNA-binding NarL/FixJ family response regulator